MLQTNVRITKNNIPEVIVALVKQENEMPKNLAAFTEGAAKAQVPVDLGNLRRSIKTRHTGRGKYTVSAKSTEGGAPRDYAHYVEYGTRYTRAQPYMGPAYRTMLRTGLPAEVVEFSKAITSAAR